MSKNPNPHYVPFKDRKWVMCNHPLKNCTAMNSSGLCAWNTTLDKCEYGYLLSLEEIRRNTDWCKDNFQVVPPKATGE